MSFLARLGEETARVLESPDRPISPHMGRPSFLIQWIVYTYVPRYLFSLSSPSLHSPVVYDLSHHVMSLRFKKSISTTCARDQFVVIETKVSKHKTNLSSQSWFSPLPFTTLSHYEAFHPHIHLTSQRNHYHPQNDLHIHHQRRRLHRQGRSRPDA